ncbi:transglutaminase-like domain-containing protein [Euzebya tangerina]|uniref:transglutaminase-like domain-containing protein n=1 Tax=Euzebya tangerina TaxID=591198 RepID=UPI000E3239AF|nr:transglutaminase family protein [Euzebya tangerina]
MHRSVQVHLEVDITRQALLAFQIAIATHVGQQQLLASVDGQPVFLREIAAPHDGRMHLLDAEPGMLIVDYTAQLEGRLLTAPGSEHDPLLYRRPSRYCPSDRFLALEAAEFGHITEPGDAVNAVADWVQRRLTYSSGSSGPTDDAVDSLLLGEGVCRDYAHVVISMLRARDIPARLAAVYAPGLSPMDFHAVAEAWVDGSWRVVDATGLAPRGSMLRIATGRDASDTAFLSVHDGSAELVAIEVTAVVDELPVDRGHVPATLS